MRAYFLEDFGAERRSIASYVTERQTKRFKKEAADGMKEYKITYYRLILNTYLILQKIINSWKFRMHKRLWIDGFRR